MRRFLKVLRSVGITILVLGGLLLTLKLILDKALPIGEKGEKAENLAQKMLEAINHKKWEEIEAIKWNFDNRHRLLWDRRRHYAKIEWDNYEAYIDCNSKQGYVLKNAEKVAEGDELTRLLERAYFIWANDSYWLNPISKIYDDGVERKYVATEDGEGALLVTYSTGGVTPGDSYLWYVDENGLPYKWEMWVKIIPIKGVKSTWEGWEQSSYGPWYSTLHQMGPISTEILDVEMTLDLHNWDNGEDPFDELDSD